MPECKRLKATTPKTIKHKFPPLFGGLNYEISAFFHSNLTAHEWRTVMTITIQGVGARLVRTDDAFNYLGLRRSKFYMVAKRLKIAPIPNGKFSLWRATDLDRIAEFVEAGQPIPEAA